MGDIVRRLLWFFVVSCSVAYAIFLIIGSTISAQSTDGSRQVLVRDVIQPGAHHLSGMVMVPSDCLQLSVKTHRVSTTTYWLDFRTWREPSVFCGSEETPRAFRTVVFAPSDGNQFLGSLDERPLTLVILPYSPR